MNRLDEILPFGQVSLKEMSASVDELSRLLSKATIADYDQAKIKRKILDYLSVCHDVLSDCYSAIADSMEDEP